MTSHYVCTSEMSGSDFPVRRSVPNSPHSLAHQSIIIKHVFDFLTIQSLLAMNRDVESGRKERKHIKQMAYERMTTINIFALGAMSNVYSDK